MLLGDAHHVADVVHRNQGGDLGDEVDLAPAGPLFYGGVDDRSGVGDDVIVDAGQLLGVKAAAIRRRILVCRGGSIAMKPCAASSSSGGIDSNVMPLPERKSPGRWVTSTRSACRTTAQKPSSLGSSNIPFCTGRCQEMGRLAPQFGEHLLAILGGGRPDSDDDRSAGS